MVDLPPSPEPPKSPLGVAENAPVVGVGVDIADHAPIRESVHRWGARWVLRPAPDATWPWTDLELGDLGVQGLTSDGIDVAVWTGARLSGRVADRARETGLELLHLTVARRGARSLGWCAGTREPDVNSATPHTRTSVHHPCQDHSSARPTPASRD